MIVLARNFGQLGNRLLLSAHLMAAAREYGVTFVNPSFAEYAQYFTATANDLWCRYPAVSPAEQLSSRPPLRPLRLATYKTIYLSGKIAWYCRRLGCPLPIIRLKHDQKCDLASDQFKQLAQSPVPLLVSGWGFRSEPLLKKHAHEIRRHYQIVPRHCYNVAKLMKHIRQQAGLVVGVHIRQGDYATFENGKYFYTIAQYISAMHRIRNRLEGRDVVFLVCGNTTLNRSDFGELKVHFGTGHEVEDMYALAETDFLTGPPSTYTGWASFYGSTPLEYIMTADQSFDLSSILSPDLERCVSEPAISAA